MMNWMKELSENLRTAEDLARYVPMTGEERRRVEQVLERFPMSVTRYYLSLIDFGDPNDPIRKMAIPALAETDLAGSFDTSGEAGNTVLEGLQHKYAETVMMISCNECAMYCRHCFRKRLVGISEDEVARNFEAMREYIMAHPEISNVLVSGGDALLNSNARLRTILQSLADIPHLDVIRICTRVPVVFPQRITGDNALLEVLAEAAEKKQVVMVTQFNHPREVTPEATRAVRTVQLMGVPVKNQTVLLRGVNDDAATLSQLLRALTRIGASPYYVFQCRPVSGVMARFQVPLHRGYHIVQEAKKNQSGLGKTFRYCLSHVSGKLEILGEAGGGDMLFQYHEAADKKDLGRILRLPVAEDAGWLGELD